MIQAEWGSAKLRACFHLDDAVVAGVLVLCCRPGCCDCLNGLVVVSCTAWELLQCSAGF